MEFVRVRGRSSEGTFRCGDSTKFLNRSGTDLVVLLQRKHVEELKKVSSRNETGKTKFETEKSNKLTLGESSSSASAALVCLVG